jgi:hypothetical protein
MIGFAFLTNLTNMFYGNMLACNDNISHDGSATERVNDSCCIDWLSM